MDCYDYLNEFFIPVIVYLFAILLVAQFAFLRKGVVNNASYKLVMLGIVFSIISDTIAILESFYDSDIAYNKITLMLFYGLSQYFIVIGILKETEEGLVTKF
jgi:hypothetical protein